MHVRYLEAWYGYEMMHGQFFMPIFQGSNDTFGLEPKLSTQEIVQAQEMDATYTCHSHGVHSLGFIISCFLPSLEFDQFKSFDQMIFRKLHSGSKTVIEAFVGSSYRNFILYFAELFKCM